MWSVTNMCGLSVFLTHLCSSQSCPWQPFSACRRKRWRASPMLPWWRHSRIAQSATDPPCTGWTRRHTDASTPCTACACHLRLDADDPAAVGWDPVLGVCRPAVWLTQPTGEGETQRRWREWPFYTAELSFVVVVEILCTKRKYIHILIYESE